MGQNLRFAPTFAYEMVWDLLNFALLMWLARRKSLQLRAGDLLWIYGIFYSIGRFFLEDVRLDSAIVGGVKDAADDRAADHRALHRRVGLAPAARVADALALEAATPEPAPADAAPMTPSEENADPTAEPSARTGPPREPERGRLGPPARPLVVGARAPPPPADSGAACKAR